MTAQRIRAATGGILLDLKVGEELTLDLRAHDTLLVRAAVDIEQIRLTLLSKDGQRARFRVQAAKTVKVGRPEPAQA